MPGERQAESRRVDVDVPALGIVDEHGLAETELLGERLPGCLVGVRAPVAYDPEGVAVPSVRAAEHVQYVDACGYVVVTHVRIQAPCGPGVPQERIGRYCGGAAVTTRVPRRPSFAPPGGA